MKHLVVANWKCNPPTLKEAKGLFNSVKKGIKNVGNIEVVICPPFVYLPIFNVHHQVMNIRLGAQDCFWEKGGAFTGEISPKMLKDLGVKYVIIGHSERRKYLKETEGMVNKKLKAVLKEGLRPILCLGEEERGSRAGIKKMKRQMEKIFSEIKKEELKNIVLIYEPVWAISTTKRSIVATPEKVKDGTTLIRDILTKLFGKKSAQSTKIIYGGNVDSKNIEGFIKEAKIDGVLIGAASLRPADFIAAVKKVDLISKI